MASPQYESASVALNYLTEKRTSDIQSRHMVFPLCESCYEVWDILVLWKLYHTDDSHRASPRCGSASVYSNNITERRVLDIGWNILFCLYGMSLVMKFEFGSCREIFFTLKTFIGLLPTMSSKVCLHILWCRKTFLTSIAFKWFLPRMS